jgi:hypothetical protein
METLLSMTSKRAGEWFKEELRELGGLGHLAKTFRYRILLVLIVVSIRDAPAIRPAGYPAG